MSFLNIKKVTSTPVELTPNTMYVVKKDESGVVDLLFTDATGNAVYTTSGGAATDESLEPFLLMGA